MFRAFLTLAVAAMATVVIGCVLLTIGLVLPARWCFNPGFQLWAWLIITAAGVRLTIEGADRISPSQHYFFVGNHQSAMDIPILALFTQGRVRFMAKKSLFYIPFLGWSIWVHGMVPIDRRNARSVKKSVDSMLQRLSKRPASLGVFPEGTRSRDGTVGQFKRGTMNICKRVAMPIVPFAIDGALEVHRRGVFRIKPGPVRLSIGQPISQEDIGQARIDELVARIRDDVIRMLNHSQNAPTHRLPNTEATAASCGGNR